jgi:hypothetical protein
MILSSRAVKPPSYVGIIYLTERLLKIQNTTIIIVIRWIREKDHDFTNDVQGLWEGYIFKLKHS